MATHSDEENDVLEEEERDTLPDLYDGLDTPDAPGLSEGRWTPCTSEGRSITSEERSITPETETEDLDEFREVPKPKVIVFDLGRTFLTNVIGKLLRMITRILVNPFKPNGISH